MSWKNTRDFHRWGIRRSQRGAEGGLKLEETVEKILAGMKEVGMIDDFKHSARHSPDDEQGIDFTVQKGEEKREFGVTISMRSLQRARIVHFPTPQFCFLPETKTETIQRKILGLFQD